mmetsp:Transcript_26135/g.77954  ORF Transcript_26135/g.77954 Transcript_26135/m.77954 type:complete len:274 (-) Transcript_26135:1090-1911(-)
MPWAAARWGRRSQRRPPVYPRRRSSPSRATWTGGAGWRWRRASRRRLPAMPRRTRKLRGASLQSAVWSGWAAWHSQPRAQETTPPPRRTSSPPVPLPRAEAMWLCLRHSSHVPMPHGSRLARRSPLPRSRGRCSSSSCYFPRGLQRDRPRALAGKAAERRLLRKSLWLHSAQRPRRVRSRAHVRCSPLGLASMPGPARMAAPRRSIGPQTLATPRRSTRCSRPAPTLRCGTARAAPRSAVPPSPARPGHCRCFCRRRGRRSMRSWTARSPTGI